jgi:hypothetical protein
LFDESRIIPAAQIRGKKVSKLRRRYVSPLVWRTLQTQTLWLPLAQSTKQSQAQQTPAHWEAASSLLAPVATNFNATLRCKSSPAMHRRLILAICLVGAKSGSFQSKPL